MDELVEASRALVKYGAFSLDNVPEGVIAVPIRMLQRLKAALMIAEVRLPRKDVAPWLVTASTFTEPEREEC